MRCTPARACVLLLLSLTVLHAAESGIRELDGGRTFLHTRLANGLEASIVADPALEVVATQVWYHVGSADEDEGSRGLAHLFEHLMFGPTETTVKDEVFHHHHRHGGDNNAYTSFDETVYVSAIAPPHHLRVLELEAARMTGLRLTAEELANEQRIVTEELRLTTENDPFARVMVRALGLALDGHPYAHTPVGTKEDIAAATLDSCRRFYERFYRPGNAHVVVVGPVDAGETLAAIERSFGAIPPREASRDEIPEVADIARRDELVLSEDLPPVETAVLFFPMPPTDHPDADALTMLRVMISGSASPFREDLVRKRKKAVEAGQELLLNRRGGALGFYAAALPYRRKATAFKQIDRGLQAVEAALTEERLEAARRRVLSGEYGGRFMAAAMASSIGRARWHGGEATDAFERPDRLRAVTLEQVRDAWCRYVADAEPLRLYLKPEKVPFWIRMFGWLYPVIS